MESPHYDTLVTPTDGENITLHDGALQVPDRPIVPFIEGDGIGRDIWAAASAVFEASVEKAYGGQREIVWFEVLAGEKAFDATGDWLPQDTLTAIQHHLVAIKGPLTTPVGGGIRSLNVALRQKLDLFACVRPVRWFEGVPSPVLQPGLVDMTIFRENTEDIYAGLEVEASIRRETQARIDRDRAKAEYARLRGQDPDSISRKALEEAEFSLQSAEEALLVAGFVQRKAKLDKKAAENAIKELEARHEESKTRVDEHRILAPLDGVVASLGDGQLDLGLVQVELGHRALLVASLHDLETALAALGGAP